MTESGPRLFVDLHHAGPDRKGGRASRTEGSRAWVVSAIPWTAGRPPSLRGQALFWQPERIMNRRTFCALFLLGSVFAVLHPALGQNPIRTLRVLTYNIHHG